jgi:hypothetical protein
VPVPAKFRFQGGFRLLTFDSLYGCGRAFALCRRVSAL